MTGPSAVTTRIHLVRHGEVHNPGRVLYGRLPDFHLSDLGARMAERVAEHLAGHDVALVVASPLERALETAAPIAAAHRLPVERDDRLLEASNHFQGSTVGHHPATLLHPARWRHLVDPFTPSWGEPYRVIGLRMLAAVDTARRTARGHEAVLVGHQLPVWTLRRLVEGRRLWHDPRSRECALASVTTLTYRDDDLVEVAYHQPAAALAAVAEPGAGA